MSSTINYFDRDDVIENEKAIRAAGESLPGDESDGDVPEESEDEAIERLKNEIEDATMRFEIQNEALRLAEDQAADVELEISDPVDGETASETIQRLRKELSNANAQICYQDAALDLIVDGAVLAISQLLQP